MQHAERTARSKSAIICRPYTARGLHFCYRCPVTLVTLEEKVARVVAATSPNFFAFRNILLKRTRVLQRVPASARLKVAQTNAVLITALYKDITFNLRFKHA